MNKLAEKVVSAMNDDELERLIDDHYASESQTLTSAAEQNLLKLAEMRGRMSDEQRARWAEIKTGFVRTQRAGGKGDDPVARVTGALGGVDEQLGKIRDTIIQAVSNEKRDPLEGLEKALSALARPQIEVHLDASASATELVREQARLLEKAIEHLSKVQPAAPAAAKVDLGEITTLIRELDARMRKVTTPALRFDVELGPETPSNFFVGVAGDVAEGGGVFVATYSKLPPLGARVTLVLSLPAGGHAEVEGTVEWTQDDLGEGSPPGFGVRVTEADDASRELIRRFTSIREPLLRE